MKQGEHLTENQIAGYRAGAFDENTSREIGRHLLKCALCRSSLPAPTVEEFWSAVMSERKTEQTSASEESERSRQPGFFAFPKIFGRIGGLAWSGAALTILFSFAFLLWLNAGWEWNQENEIAQTLNVNATESNPARIESGEQILPPKNSRDDNQISSSDSNLPVNPKSPQPNVRQNNSNSSLRENASRNSARVTKKDAPGNISTTRGGLPADCGGETLVETETGLSGKALTLSWKKVPNAVKYHLYISDDEEILIDEYETERETSYTLKKPLDAAKTYRWKVVVTTEDGKTIVGDSQKFTVKSLPLKRGKLAKKQKSPIRCSQNH